MAYHVHWTRKALKQAAKLTQRARKTVVAKAGKLSDWPECKKVLDIKALKNHAYRYRLRVGRYRVFFDIDSTMRIVSVEEVRKRDDRTY